MKNLGTTAIKIFGEKYILRKTFDIMDYKGGIYGFEVNDEDMNFLFQFDGEDKESLISEIKWRIYRSIL